MSDDEGDGDDDGDGEGGSGVDEQLPSSPTSPPVTHPPSPSRELDQQDLQSPHRDVHQEAASAAAAEFLQQAHSEAEHVQSATASEPLAATHITQAAATGGADDDNAQLVRLALCHLCGACHKCMHSSWLETLLLQRNRSRNKCYTHDCSKRW